MAVAIENRPPPSRLVSRTRLLQGLARHASAPARPQVTLDLSKTNEGHQQMGKQGSAPHPRSLASSPRSKPNLLNELSNAHSVASRYRLDRDKWSTTAQVQERKLASHERELIRQGRAIISLEEQNVALRAESEEHVSANNKLFTRFRIAVAKHDKLVDQLNDSDRAMARLMKSDRAKRKVWERNLRLKTTLKRITMQATSGRIQSAANTEASLLETLAATNARIDELERNGEVLLEALEQSNDSCGGDEDDNEKTAKLLEAEVAFRGVLEDESSKEQKEHWTELLSE
jgi:hypothetical protein